ncbi:hypothetical protein [Roseovarius sp.]|uniref:hypothetical protein n=1 Tax=Roseovarius sp. TaxID=1486281 RepID=UPI003BA86BBE
MSYRQIAEADGTVNNDTVRRNLAAANAAPDAPTKITGADGKSYPSTKPRRSTYQEPPEADEDVDPHLRNLAAMRIKGRALRHYAELMQQIEPATGMHNSPGTKKVGARPFSRTDAARAAGMSPHQHKQAMRTGNIPADQFEDMFERDDPPTVSELADAALCNNHCSLT